MKKEIERLKRANIIAVRTEFTALLRKRGWAVSDIAKVFGVHYSRVSRYK